MIDFYGNQEVIESVKKIDEELREEDSKEVADKEKITRLMFEQMLRGLYLSSI